MDRIFVRISCIVLLPAMLAALQAKQFVRYIRGTGWNEARLVCESQGLQLAVVGKFSTFFLQRAFNASPQFNNDNIWIGLYDVAQEFNKLSTEGFQWSSCKMLGDKNWANWGKDQLVPGYNKWCVRQNFSSRLEWYFETCTSYCHFLCHRNLGPCTSYRRLVNTCDLASAELNEKPPNSSMTLDECKNACIELKLVGQERCWMFNFNSSGCTLFQGKAPVYCNDTFSTDPLPTNGSWVRDCYAVSYNTSDHGFAHPNQIHAVSSCNSQNTTASLDLSPATDSDTSPPSSSSLSSLSSLLSSSSPPPPPPPPSSPSPTTDSVVASTLSAGWPQGSSVGQVSASPLIPTVSTGRCTCLGQSVLKKDAVNISDVTQQLRKKLTLDKKQLSSTRRRKESAQDNRPSSQAAGALGIAIIALITVLIVFLDFHTLYLATNKRN